MKTAVEWIFNELHSIRKTIPFEQQADAILKAFEQAKAMEKEQMILIYKAAFQDGFNGELFEFEQYYNETFKSE